jgi:hypothetical protein
VVLTTKTVTLLTFRRREAIRAFAFIPLGLLDPVAQRDVGYPEILRDLPVGLLEIRASAIASRRNSSGYGGLVRGTSHLLATVFQRKHSGIPETGGTAR